MTRERSFKAERQICQMTSEIESYKGVFTLSQQMLSTHLIPDTNLNNAGKYQLYFCVPIKKLQTSEESQIITIIIIIIVMVFYRFQDALSL